MKLDIPEDWPDHGVLDGKRLLWSEVEELPDAMLSNVVVDVPDVGEIRPFRGVSFSSSVSSDTYLSSRPPRVDKDIREHARDGIGFREDVVDQLLEANLCRKPAEQVLDVLKGATSYEGAKRKLAAALPDLDRKRLRDALNGGLLLTQAAGMLTSGREVGAGEKKGKRS